MTWEELEREEYPAEVVYENGEETVQIVYEGLEIDYR